ncbi:MAG: catalase [Deltaproteobacteria bacterium]|nr:catalase [Deltaproteobacteria bacterium]
MALVLALGASASAQPVLTKENGAPAPENQRSQTAGGYGGPVLLQDFHLVEKLARFDRERIPERVVHARGAGAAGEFVSAGDASRYTAASLFSAKGKRTPVFARFSTVIHPAGSPETVRDPRGFAVKFYTDEGNWDLVGNNLDVFFIRDAIKFPDMVHSLKPSPVTNQQDPNRFFDFFQHQPESTFMLTQLYSDRGIPANYRQMDGSSVHALKLVNAKGEAFYAKLSWRSLNGVEYLATPEAVARVQGREWSHATRDLYESIQAGRHPRWELRAQIIPVSRVNDFRFNPLDPTKRWPEAELEPVVLGVMTLKAVPENYFQSTEQVAFSPGVMVPGIEASEDKLLQGRLFAYADTQRYRVGPNYQQLPVNAPRVAVKSHIQDGPMSLVAKRGEVNYEPSAQAPLLTAAVPRAPAPDLARLNQAFAKEENFYQAGEFYRALSPDARSRLVDNFAADLAQVKSEATRARILAHLRQADAEYGARVQEAVAARMGRS